jgi:hypothetical protein
MPKAKWGSGDEALTAADIDGAQSNGFTPYSGPVPPAGLYKFVVKQMSQGQSSTGNPKLLTVMELAGDWKPNHAKYDGCPLFDHMPVMKSTAFRVKAFCEAFGLTSKEFYGGILTDEKGKVTKLGSLGDPAGLEVFVNVSKRPATDQYAESLQLNGTGYLPVDEIDEAQTSDDTDAGDDVPDDEPPF